MMYIFIFRILYMTFFYVLTVLLFFCFSVLPNSNKIFLENFALWCNRFFVWFRHDPSLSVFPLKKQNSNSLSSRPNGRCKSDCHTKFHSRLAHTQNAQKLNRLDGECARCPQSSQMLLIRIYFRTFFFLMPLPHVFMPYKKIIIRNKPKMTTNKLLQQQQQTRVLSLKLRRPHRNHTHNDVWCLAYVFFLAARARAHFNTTRLRYCSW